ncbi:MAG: hypothetical protein Q8M29_12070 [Bacteroidota bacterium]|nr:hypothetical protein [Bacteroidota bacterium]
MKLIIFVIILIALHLCTSCTQKPKNGKWEIKTNLVNGTIKADGTDLGRHCGGYIERTEDGYDVTYNKGCVECSNYRITIDTTFLSFEDYTKRYKEGVAIIEEEKTDNYYLFYIKYMVNINNTRIGGVTVSSDTVYSQGYKFLVYKQGKSKNYILEGNNESYSASPPIADKETAMTALGIAQSFEPAD